MIPDNELNIDLITVIIDDTSISVLVWHLSCVVLNNTSVNTALNWDCIIQYIKHSPVHDIIITEYHVSGQVREFNVHIRASCCSARLSRAQVLAYAGSSVRDRTMYQSTIHLNNCNRQLGTRRGSVADRFSSHVVCLVSTRFSRPIGLFSISTSAPQLV